MIFLAIRRKIAANSFEARLRMRALQSAISDILPGWLCDGLIPSCPQKTICCFCLDLQHWWPSHSWPPAVVALLCPLFRRQLLPRQLALRGPRPALRGPRPALRGPHPALRGPPAPGRSRRFCEMTDEIGEVSSYTWACILLTRPKSCR